MGEGWSSISKRFEGCGWGGRYSRVAEKRNTFGSEGARVFLKIFAVPLFFAKKPLRRSFGFSVSPTDFFRRGAPSKGREPQGASFLGPPRGSTSTLGPGGLASLQKPLE